MTDTNDGFFTRIFGKKNNEEAIMEPDPTKIAPVGRQLPHTMLSFTPEQEAKYSAEEKEALQQQLLELPPLTIGQINFVPVDAGGYQGGYYIKMFIRNGRDISEELVINHLKLTLVDSTGEEAAKGVFELNNFGQLPFGESRYWTFMWREGQVLKKNADLSEFSIRIG